ncbi:MAG: hypothetical protein JXR95_02410 [Deltaproteobacteria bacterium]|nr:hypothetical protein [Deltaproteobacteria bacterium]
MLAVLVVENWWVDFHRFNSSSGILSYWSPHVRQIRSLKNGSRIYFLLKSPIRQIAGHGIFMGFNGQTVKSSWEKYGNSLGVGDLRQLIYLWTKRNDIKISEEECLSSDMGNILLSECIFFNESDYFEPSAGGLEIPLPMGGIKYFEDDYMFVESRRNQRLHSQKLLFSLLKIGVPVFPVQGYEEFQHSVFKAYSGKCAVTGESSPELLKAINIQPFLSPESNHVQNGILLRVDLGVLFEKGLISIDEENRLLISSRLISDTYRIWEGVQFKLPDDKFRSPTKNTLEYHRNYVFRN